MLETFFRLHQSKNSFSCHKVAWHVAWLIIYIPFIRVSFSSLIKSTCNNAVCIFDHGIAACNLIWTWCWFTQEHTCLTFARLPAATLTVQCFSFWAPAATAPSALPPLLLLPPLAFPNQEKSSSVLQLRLQHKFSTTALAVMHIYIGMLSRCVHRFNKIILVKRVCGTSLRNHIYLFGRTIWES